MSERWEPIPFRGAAGDSARDAERPLALEVEFDGLLRPHAPSDADPCDPTRYWEFFASGTD